MRKRAGAVSDRERAASTFNRGLDELCTSVADGGDWAEGLARFDRESAELRRKRATELRDPGDRAAFERHADDFTGMQRIGLKRALVENQQTEALTQRDDQLAYYAGKPIESVDLSVANLPPVTGLLGLRWEHPARMTGAEVVCRMAAAIDSDDFTEHERGNPTRTPPDGLPGYAVISLRGWHRLNPHLLASLAIENANDLDYRIMDSGVMEPGTNVVFTMQADF